ncbi:transmembrane sensor [Catalinimonas alkaloidigena]|uniref:FecR domain-containing protein n=1 Tax=Catalinimonas alkaloidigena TaxID=1075417 RepID=UPI0024069606|nr:FecR domain-containing protein [Catalinimonas alkaloidigena]MDF9798996.1 transmembrane sensor [Catalinimonas alkaloidigena]
MPDPHYTAKDFLLDEHFHQWVKSPTTEINNYWQEFIRLHPEAKQEIEEARSIILQLDFQENKRAVSAKTRIKAKIDSAIQEKAQPGLFGNERHMQLSDTRKLFTRSWFAVAATVSGLILLASIYFLLTSSLEVTEYHTAYGETKKLRLPDSSLVVLNANSSLSLEESSWKDAAERTVWLEGEAFFEVEEKVTPSGQPAKFIVHTGSVHVEVLGTAFNVNHRHQETKVVLSSGSVKLNLRQASESAEREIMMEPGDMVAVSKVKREVVKKVVDTSHYTSWKENKLLFDHTPITEIIQLIEDNYGLKVSVQSTGLLEREFTGAAPADKLDILLAKMAVVYNLKIDRNDQKITITDK